MRIALIPSAENFGNDNATAVIHTRELANNLSKNSDILLLAFSSNQNINKSKNIHARYVTEYLPLHKFFIIETLYKYFFLPIILLKRFNNFNPDYVYCRYGSLSIQSLIAAKLLRIKYITEVNGFKISEEYSEQNNFFKIFLLKFYEKLIYHYSNKIISVSDGIRQKIIKIYKILPENIYTVNNGANIHNFKPINNDKNKLNIPKNKFVIGFIGNITKWQGLQYLVEAAQLLLKKQRDILFLIVGEGEYLNTCKMMVKKNGLEEYFTFTGQINYNLIPKYINSFDLGVAPFIKNRIASPIKIFEYMACAKPIISSDISDVKKLHKSNDYITFFKANNSKDLSDKLEYSINNIKILNNKAEHGRKILLENYSWKITAEKILKIISKI